MTELIDWHIPQEGTTELTFIHGVFPLELIQPRMEDARCSPRFLSFRHGAIKPFIFAQRDILHFLEGRKLKHRTSEARCSPRFLSFRHGAIKPFIFAQRDILHFLEGRKLKHRTSEVSSNHFVPTDRKVDSQRFSLPPVQLQRYAHNIAKSILYRLEYTLELFSESSIIHEGDVEVDSNE
eukprot:scaffold14451_cov70-Skeletonema_marinoi.AAC.3